MIPPEVIFFTLAFVVLASAIGMVLNRNAIYCALFLVLNFVTVGLLYVELGAPFIAMAQVTVYAGAIMVLFLFVIMMLGAERLSEEEPIRGHRPVALGLGALSLVAVAVLVVFQTGPLTPLPTPPLDFASPAEVGMTLYSRYILPFEITSVILLVAVVGAIVLTRHDRPVRRAAQPLPKEK